MLLLGNYLREPSTYSYLGNIGMVGAHYDILRTYISIVQHLTSAYYLDETTYVVTSRGELNRHTPRMGMWSRHDLLTRIKQKEISRRNHMTRDSIMKRAADVQSAMVLAAVNNEHISVKHKHKHRPVDQPSKKTQWDYLTDTIAGHVQT